MLLSHEKIKALLGYDFSIDFIKITLTQRGSESPIVYSGPGTIYQKPDGYLHLKLYHTFLDVKKELLSRGSSTTPGKILGDEHYFDLESTDISGASWVAEKVYVTKSFSYPAAGKIIETKSRELRKVETRYEMASKDRSYLFFLANGKYEIPANKIEELPDGGKHRNTCSFSFDGYDLEIRAKENFLTVKMSLPKDNYHENIVWMLIESLNILFGSHLRPIFLSISHDKVSESRIFSVSANFQNSPVPRPIPCSFPKDIECFMAFIQRYLYTFNMPHDELYGYWRKVNRAWQGGIVHASLALTVAIEGIIKNYFKTYGEPTSEFIKQVDDALLKIREIELGPRIKSRILSSTGQAKSSSPKSALYALATEGWFCSELVDEWVRLRNMSAHAEKEDDEEIQKYVDMVYKCTRLFYSLMFIIIGYDKCFYDFAIEGWPESEFTQIAIPKKSSSIDKLHSINKFPSPGE